ncbi:hypothetical protein ALISP_6852 [Alicycliphilus sp. B1]|nr:hypothetical protein ALISP_6852 [Alicycliphilus sp. B1]
MEADALQIAAAMLPRATAVKAIADCTVAGSTHRNSTPVYSSGVTSGCSTGLSPHPNSGNSAKVLATTSTCSRQWPRPASTASRESLAPCMKNSSATTATVAFSKKAPTVPEAGSTLASTTVATSARVKLSGSRRDRAMAGAKREGWGGSDRFEVPIGAHAHSKKKLISLMNL